MNYDYTQRGVDCKDVWVSKCGKKERKKLIKVVINKLGVVINC
jgi:hypothetical protein